MVPLLCLVRFESVDKPSDLGIHRRGLNATYCSRYLIYRPQWDIYCISLWPVIECMPMSSSTLPCPLALCQRGLRRLSNSSSSCFTSSVLGFRERAQSRHGHFRSPALPCPDFECARPQLSPFGVVRHFRIASLSLAL